MNLKQLSSREFKQEMKATIGIGKGVSQAILQYGVQTGEESNCRYRLGLKLFSGMEFKQEMKATVDIE